LSSPYSTSSFSLLSVLLFSPSFSSSLSPLSVLLLLLLLLLVLFLLFLLLLLVLSVLLLLSVAPASLVPCSILRMRADRTRVGAAAMVEVAARALFGGATETPLLSSLRSVL
jgi:hypothetical protein